MMNVEICKTVFLTYNFKLCRNVINSHRHLSTSLKLYMKKKYRMKNKFTFKDEFTQIAKSDVKLRTFSPDFISVNNDSDENIDDGRIKTRRFVSADLIPEKNQSSVPSITVPQKGKIKKHSLTYQGEIVFGVHPVYLALLQKRRTLHHLYTREDIHSESDGDSSVSRKEEIIKLAKLLNIPISFIDSRGLRILAPNAVHQGICLDAGFLPLSVWNEEVTDLNSSEDKPLWLVLDEILDPMNVGAIIRSAYYFGVNRLFTVRGNSCKLSPTVSKASSGTLEVMDIFQIGNLEDFVKERKDRGWHIVSTLAFSNKSESIESPISASEFSTSKPTILILGNEARGISQNILKLCDSLISIEPGRILHEGIDSLNVSVATGILLHTLSNSKKNIKR